MDVGNSKNRGRLYVGLDVYLYECEDREKAKAAEKSAEDERDKNWNAGGKKYEDITATERDEITAKNKLVDEKFGIVDYNHESCTKIEVDSKNYPDHLFKIGYLRSSYNGSGFNNIMTRRGLKTLYDIFLPGERYEFVPDWKATLDRANDALDEYKKFLASPVGKYDVFTEDVRSFRGVGIPGDELEAMEVFRQELAKHQADTDKFMGSGYSNSHGMFDFEGIKVVALIRGTKKGLGAILGKNKQDLDPAVHVVYERELDKDGRDWHMKGLEIVVEMCEFVLSHPNPGHFSLHWSS